jgi:hypothetical protein
MASLTDLFNPTFLMFLGILVLVVALLVVYFESKMREQNHKITAMFSLVSTLAEDMNGIKMGFNQIATMQYGGAKPLEEVNVSVNKVQQNKLIEVSDDDVDDDDVDDDDVDIDDDDESDNENVENESDNDSASEADDNSSLGKYIDEMESEHDSLSETDLNENVEQERITVFKLKEDINENVEEEESIDDLASELSDGGLEDVENIEEELIKEEHVLDVSNLKTISINLEEPAEKIDYKKLQLPKLRSAVVEKGLATNLDASKLKKAELLKLLGIE